MRTQNITIYRKDINAMKKKGKTWEEVADHYKVSVSAIYRFLKTAKRSVEIRPFNGGHVSGGKVKRENGMKRRVKAANAVLASADVAIKSEMLPVISAFIRKMKETETQAVLIDLRKDELVIVGSQQLRASEVAGE